MYKKVLFFIFFLFLSISTSAIDMNETTVIIEEATQATKELRDDFSKLINEPTQNSEEEISKPESNTTQEVIATEVIVVTEINTTNEKETISKELNSSNITPLILVEENATLISDDNQSVVVEEQDTTLIVETNLSNELNSTQEQEDELEGSVTKGLVIFKTRLKGPCGMTGEEFAKSYTQEDWDDIYDNNEFEKEVIKICPKMEGRYQERWTPHLYQFSLKYASDSDEIPEC